MKITPLPSPTRPLPITPLGHRRFASLLTAAVLVLASGGAGGERASAQQKLNPGGAVKRSQAAPASTVQTTRSAFDYTGLGGCVYATGLGDVTVTVHHWRDFLGDGFQPYETTVHLRHGEAEQLLGANNGKTRTIRLGRLERGEIRLIARCPAGDGTFESGAGSRNADGAPHSRVRTVKPGVVEVYFENTMTEGTKNDRTEQHWYKDVKLTFTGAVTADEGMLFLLNRLNDPDPATRDAAREALKAASPEMARLAGVR